MLLTRGEYSFQRVASQNVGPRFAQIVRPSYETDLTIDDLDARDVAIVVATAARVKVTWLGEGDTICLPQGLLSISPNPLQPR